MSGYFDDRYVVSYWHEGNYSVNGPDGEVARGLTYREAQRMADRLNADLEASKKKEND